MPYVSDVLREIVDDELNSLIGEIFRLAEPDEYTGIMNYCITLLLVTVIKKKYGDQWRYAGVNEMIGILECAKLELYRRGGGPYEDKCIEKNGDIDCYLGV